MRSEDRSLHHQPYDIESLVFDEQESPPVPKLADENEGKKVVEFLRGQRQIMNTPERKHIQDHPPPFEGKTCPSAPLTDKTNVMMFEQVHVSMNTRQDQMKVLQNAPKPSVQNVFDCLEDFVDAEELSVKEHDHAESDSSIMTKTISVKGKRRSKSSPGKRPAKPKVILQPPGSMKSLRKAHMHETEKLEGGSILSIISAFLFVILFFQPQIQVLFYGNSLSVIPTVQHNLTDEMVNATVAFAFPSKDMAIVNDTRLEWIIDGISLAGTRNEFPRVVYCEVLLNNVRIHSSLIVLKSNDSTRVTLATPELPDGKYNATVLIEVPLKTGDDLTLRAERHYQYASSLTPEIAFSYPANHSIFLEGDPVQLFYTTENIDRSVITNGGLRLQIGLQDFPLKEPSDTLTLSNLAVGNHILSIFVRSGEVKAVKHQLHFRIIPPTREVLLQCSTKHLRLRLKNAYTSSAEKSLIEILLDQRYKDQLQVTQNSTLINP